MKRVLLVLSLCGACKSGDSRRTAPQALRPEVAALVQRFVRADTSGMADSAVALLSRCEVGPSADYLEPTVAVTVESAPPHGDTEFVNVDYIVLGKATSVDMRKRGPASWRFNRHVATSRLTLPVLKLTSGRWRNLGNYLPIR